MIKINKEFGLWLKENNSFYEKLKKHDSVLYSRFMPVFEVLLYLYSNEIKDSDNANEDVIKIFQVGLEYLHSQIGICKIYLEKVFKDDFHAFLGYDSIVNYILFIEDLQYELHENKTKFDKKKLDALTHYLEAIIMKKKEIPDNVKIYMDSEIHDVIGNDEYKFNSIIDIFVEIANTLNVDLFNEEDIIVGKDV
jgi:hypothetical protein